MKIAVMQPYFFPYIGYFQLINSVDTFVIYDDVNYINRGWINRNRILLNGNEHLFTLNLVKASQNKLINGIEIIDESSNRCRMLSLIKQAYEKAPYFKQVMPILEQIVVNNESKLSKYLEYSIRKIVSVLGIPTNILISSQIDKHPSRKGQYKIIDIAKKLEADEYINPPGGQELYDRDLFSKKNIKLSFLLPNTIKYPQFNDNFIANLSIIDTMMFNSVAEISKMLNQYELI